MGINRPFKKNISVKEFAEGIALKKFMHPFILVDKNGEIHYSLGKCDKYFSFHGGEPGQNIVNISREGLRTSLSNALRQINRDSNPVYYNNIKVKVHDGFEVVNFTLTPVANPSFNHLFIVDIEPVRISHILSEINREDENDISDSSEDYIRLIEQELQDTRDHLNNVIEELETSNDELKSLNKEARSTNEELQNANEELETSKEEMQSLNEELETSNKELQRQAGERTEQKARFHLASIVESTDDAIFTESPEGKILTWNQGAVKLYGYQDQEAISLSSRELHFYPDDGGDAAVMEKARKGENIKNQETVHKHKNGSMVPVSITICPIKDDEGKIVAISNIVKDITYIKEREEELVRARDATEQAANLKSMFLANMSHEIRTPLNSILGFADMLRREVSDEKAVRYLENINNSSRQLLYLINDIVDVSRLDAGELTVHCSSIGLGELMNLVKDQFEGYASKNKNINIDFRLKLPEDKEDLYVVTDEYRLQQILRNLLSNAFKYTDEGYIEFGYEVRKSNLLFYVSDTGAGISKENHEKVFDRFQQAGNGRNNKKKVIRGTGLGLAIARGLTERLGGKMWLSSEEGKGSVFYFTIPYMKGEATKNNTSHVREEVVLIPQFKGKKIIIAEDDPYSLEMLKIMLQDTKITMFVARDGDEVMAIFNKEPVDILLLDIRMPKKDGYELAREIRSSYPGIPIIAQSAFAMPEQIHKSLEMGFNQHLVKPLKREDLYHTLETYLK